MPQTQDAILLREAVTAAKVGNKAAARQLLRQASVHNPNNELVWLWRASLSESPKEATFYLGEVLRINPHNQKATSWMEKCKGVTGGAQATAVAEEPKPVGQNVSQPPEPRSGGVAGGPHSPATMQGILRVTESVGTTTVRPAETAPAGAATNGAATSNTDVAPTRSMETSSKPVETAVKVRPAVIPFDQPAARVSTPLAAQHSLNNETSKNQTASNQTAHHLTAHNQGTPIHVVAKQTAAHVQPAHGPATHKWRCPFCAHGAEVPIRRCSSCRAITVLEDLKEVEKNEGVQEKVVRDALSRYETLPADKRTFEVNMSLALGHLNLRETTAALPYLKAAAGQKRNDWTLTGILDQIQWRKVILVVDDSLTIRKALSSILEKNDFRVVSAEDGSHALNKLNDAVPDLVLLDITMPWMDGYEVCKNIKSKPLTKKVPVVMLSGKDGLFDKVRGKLAGCNDYITKPFDPEALLKTLRKYLA